MTYAQWNSVWKMKGSYYHNKRKIINDPVYGFISIPDELVFDIIEHPYFQRLRRVRQLGLTNYVYPGAVHSRFQHALGAVYLMNSALEVIQQKGCELSHDDWLGALLAILLHDVGHAPFSHTLEHVFISDMSHEKLSLLYMEELNNQFGGQLDTALAIFKGEHPKKFLRQLVSSQLDMDRLDYLRRDSYFTGVTEGVIGSERIIKMLRVVDDQLVVDRKGIYSIEKFLISRRLMYWQVYLHKTVIAAEQMLVKTLDRAREMADLGMDVSSSPALARFLFSNRANSGFSTTKELLDAFARLDDTDIVSSLKEWSCCNDLILSRLADGLLNRKLPAILIQDTPFSSDRIDFIRNIVMRDEKLDQSLVGYLVFSDNISNSAYNEESDQVMLYENTGNLTELSEASNIINPSLLSKADNKYFLCFPKEYTGKF